MSWTGEWLSGPSRSTRGAASLLAERPRGSGGGVILPHRTIITIPLTGTDVAIAVGLSAGFTLLAFKAAPVVFAMWRSLFSYGSAALGLAGQLGTARSSVLGGSFIPVLSVQAAAPERTALIVGLGVIAALLVVAHVVAARALPVSYLLRAIAVVLASSIVVFASGARPASLELPLFARTMLKMSVGIWLLVPIGYGLTLFLLDIDWHRKAALMTMAMMHLALFIPLQQLVTLYVVKHLTLLVVPVVFVFGSVLPQIAVLIALYSWGASWPGRA